MYKRLKDEPGLTSIELAFIIVGISGISILTGCTVIVVHIMPKFDAMYRDLGVELPLPTQILAGATDAFQTYWWMGLLIVIIGAVGLRQYLRLETDQSWFQSWFNRLRVKLSPKHLTVFIGLFVVLVGGTIGFSAVALVLPIFKANQLLG